MEILHTLQDDKGWMLLNLTAQADMGTIKLTDKGRKATKDAAD